MIASAKTKNGKVIHRAIDMGGFLYIACHSDPTTMKTERVQGEVTCKKCLGLKNAVLPDYQFSEGIQSLKHPFCRKEHEDDGHIAGYHDGKENIKKYLLQGLRDEFIKAYNEGYFEGQQIYTYHYKNGDVKGKPLTNVPLRTFRNSNQSTSDNRKQNITAQSTFSLAKLINRIKNFLN